MRKYILAMIFLFSLFIVSCSTNYTPDNNENKPIDPTLQQLNQYDKDEYFEKLSSDLKILFDDVLPVSDIKSVDEKSSIRSYVITKKIHIDDILLDTENHHLSITYNINDGSIESINTFTTSDNNINFAYIANVIALNLDENINIDEFDEKYKLLLTEDIFENDISGEEEKFKVFKSVNDEYISLYITIK